MGGRSQGENTKVECDEVEDGKGSETSMRGLAIKATMSEI